MAITVSNAGFIHAMAAEKQILIGGYYGGNNIGDEAILRAMLDAFRSRHTGLSFNVVSHAPQETRQRHAVEAVHWREIPALAEAVCRSDLVLIGGGGLFMDYWGLDEESYFRILHGGISTYGTLAGLAAAFGIPYALVGVGVGPLASESAREHTRRIFSQARLATVRDPESLALLDEIGLSPLPDHIHLTADLAFGLQPGPQDEAAADRFCDSLGIRPDKPVLGISVRYWDFPVPPSDWLPSLAQAVRDFLTEADTQALLLPFQVGEEGSLTDDLQLSRRLIQTINLPDRLHLLPQVPDIYVMQSLISRCDLLLGMRLHGLLMAINGHIPAVALAYDPKVNALMNLVGFSQLTCALPPSATKLSDMLKQTWLERESLSNQARQVHKRLKSQTDKNMEYVSQVLDSLSPKPGANPLQDFVIARLSQLQSVDTELLNEKVRTQTLSLELNEALSQATLLRQRLHELETSQTYRLALKVQGLRNALVPPASRRERLSRAFLRRFRRESQG